jgi:hypothetical protein
MPKTSQKRQQIGPPRLLVKQRPESFKSMMGVAEVKGTDARAGSDSRTGARQQPTRVAMASAL